MPSTRTTRFHSALCAAALASAALAGCGGGSGATAPAAKNAATHSVHALAVTSAADTNLLSWVNPFIGTTPGPVSPQNTDVGWHAGNTFPGATLPFGMVQFSPDTGYGENYGLGGYIYNKGVLQGMSLIHTSGTGCTVSQDISFMPFVGNIGNSPATHLSDYQVGYSHNNEHAVPGSYSVAMNNGVTAEMTVTTRTGFGRFTYPNTNDAMMILNVGRNGVGVRNAQLTLINNDTVEGFVSTGGVCGTGGYVVYFHGQFDKPFASFGTYANDNISAGSRGTSQGTQNGGWVKFNGGGQVQFRVGVSYVSIANAAANMQAENPNWDFNGLRTTAQNTWNTALNKFQVTGGSNDDRTKFYTAVYHTMLHPNVNSDVNGQYLGFDGQVYTASGWNKYGTFSGWDIYRAEVQLLGWVAPKEASDMAQSMVVDAQKGGGGFPKWPMGNNDGCIMAGDAGTLIVTNLYAFGGKNFDTATALQLLDHAASTPGVYSRGCEQRSGLSYYLNQGYVPYDSGIGAPIASTLEYSVADASISQFAGALGDTDRQNIYLQRSQNWKNVFSTGTGYISQREGSGDYIANFSAANGDGFAEGTPGQYTWMVPQNLRGLLDHIGGNAKAIARLDDHFTYLDGGPGSQYAWLGNEPEGPAAWVYNFAGAPYKTQALVRRIMSTLYGAGSNGLPGNDDLGAMSSWYVWGALGLFPEIPGVGGFTIGSPLFPSVAVKMGNGKTLTINGANAGANGTYIQSLQINGQNTTNTWLPLTSLTNDTTLNYVLGSSPNTSWGSGAADAPPSFDAPPAGSLVGTQSGRCLDSPNAANGTKVLLWDCTAGLNQLWVRQPNGSLQAHGQCLDASGQGTTPGTVVAMWTCNGGANQQWKFNADGSVVGVQSGLCLDVTGASTANNSAIELWTCNGGANQHWSDRPVNATSVALQGTASGRCLDAPNAADGTKMLLWDCNGDNNQQWVRQSNGTVTVHGKCLDVSGGTAPGGQAEIVGCSGGSSQKWQFYPDNSIRNTQSGLCLDVTGAATADNSAVGLWTCSGATNQQWAKIL